MIAPLLRRARIALYAVALLPLIQPVLAQSVTPVSPMRKSSSPATPAPRTATNSPPNQGAWNELTPAEKQSLKPLAATWGQLSEGQRRKWRALASNFSTMKPPEQATLHSRMTEWAALSPKDRSQARLNFAETKKMPPDEKLSQWQASPWRSIRQSRAAQRTRRQRPAPGESAHAAAGQTRKCPLSRPADALHQWPDRPTHFCNTF